MEILMTIIKDKQNNQQKRKTALLDSESGHFDYGIKEWLEKETSSEQIAVDVEATKVNLYKAPIERNIHVSQNESEEGDYSSKRRETTHLIVQKLPKLPTPYRKENDIVNLALMKIDPSKVLDERNMKINPIQEDEIIWCHRNTLTTKNNHNTKEKGIVTDSNTIKIINKRSFSSLGNNRDINSQKVISKGTRHESLKEQDREVPRVRFKAIKMSKENPYINNGSAKSDGSTVALLTGALVVYRSINKPVGSSSRVPGVDMNRKGLLQKELTMKIGCYNINGLKTTQQKFETLGQWLDDEAFDIFAVMETNLNRKEGFFVEKKVENFRFFWLNISIDKRKGLGIALGIKHAWKKYLEGVDRISEFIIVARFYFRNMELIIIMIYIPPNNGSEMDKVLKEITDIYSKHNKRTHIVILGNFNCVMDLELDKISKSKNSYFYDQAITENWEDFRSVLNKKLQKEKTTLNKLLDTNNIKNRKEVVEYS
ncbi:8063_t:CDS:2 [Gigaspora margarita]|uniref:8063_t:CDS:1 n=1 Tax=Gigaspora margarita TaxID=4874 RepID=A0ABN7V2P7_GIGMA|nr:8063_t:CDS:2 [Gigaspora margarita]